MIALLEDRRASLVKEVDDTYTKYFKKLWAEREHLETTITSMEGALQFSKRVLDCKNDTMLLVLSSQVMPRLKELGRQEWNSSRADEIERTSLKWNEARSVQTYIPRKYGCTKQVSDTDLIGNVQAHYEAMSRITLTLQNVPQEVECGQQIEFQVTAATVPLRALKSVKIEGSVWYTTKQIQNQSLVDKPGLFPNAQPQMAITCTIEPGETRNLWTVRFTPAEVGACSIDLTASAVYTGASLTMKLLGGGGGGPLKLSANTSTHEIQVAPPQQK